MDQPDNITAPPDAPLETPIDTPLAAHHRSSGAHLGSWFGHALPDYFTNPREEQRYLNESVALLDKSYRAHLTFTGPDRARYLNAILTNDVKNLPIGAGNKSLFLNPQGRILAELQVFALPDRLFAASHAMLRPRLIEQLEKYIIMDDVTLTDETDAFATLALEGPQAFAIVHDLAATDFAAMPDMTTLDIAIRNPERTHGAIPARLMRTTALSAELVAQRKDLPVLWKILEDAARRAQGGPAGYTALSAQRLAQGIPWFGYDFGEKQIPHEAGLQDSHISYTKGCYTGQEIVERVRSRGQVNRRRVLLRFAENAPVPAAGAAVAHNGADAGHITRAARSHYPAAVLAMAYLRKEAAAQGTTVTCAGHSAIVTNSP
jgi:folate-binding protein YgfZ